MIFDKFNDTIPFVNEESKSESILYEPVKKLGPTLFPSLIKNGSDEEKVPETEN